MSTKQDITDQVGQTVRLGSKVVVKGTKALVTGRVTYLSHTFITVEQDDTTRWRRIAPWQVVVYGEGASA